MAAEKGKNKKGMGKGKAEVKTKLPELLKSDDFTGLYKEDAVHLVTTLSDAAKYQQAYNKAWNVSHILHQTNNKILMVEDIM